MTYIGIKNNKFRNAIIVHPFLFPVFSILFLASRNMGQIPVYQAALPLAVALGLTVPLLIIAKWVFRDARKAGLAVTLIWVLFFSYGHVYNMLPEFTWGVGGPGIGRNKLLMLSWAVIFVAGIFLVARARRGLDRLTDVLNAIALSLVAVSLISIVSSGLRADHGAKNIGAASGAERGAPEAPGATALPDIYYIILDGYDSAGTLREVFNYDNSEFIGYLSSKGFYVASGSKSNYAHTSLSLASSLNMEYINYLTEKIGPESDDHKALYKMIIDNKVMLFLKSRGYKFIHLGSGNGVTDRNKHADLEFRRSGTNDFNSVLVQTTALWPFVRGAVHRNSRDLILDTFFDLGEIHKIKGPKFIFAHIVCPHPPYTFGPSGEIVDGKELNMRGGDWGRKEKYLDQLMFVNKKVKVLVGKILAGSEVPPIIVLQADHGSASSAAHPDSVWYLDPIPTGTLARERMGILNAYYLPARGKDLLYDSISPVNTFRLIFGHYFGTKDRLLDDKSYYSIYGKPYKFTDVTDMVKHDQ